MGTYGLTQSLKFTHLPPRHSLHCTCRTPQQLEPIASQFDLLNCDHVKSPLCHSSKTSRATASKYGRSISINRYLYVLEFPHKPLVTPTNLSNHSLPSIVRNRPRDPHPVCHLHYDAAIWTRPRVNALLPHLPAQLPNPLLH
jgi:hypothetical protein